MKELSEILAAHGSLPCKDAALATVVRVEGSSYRRPGARMLIAPDGQVVGGVSGGCLERDVIRRAGGVIAAISPMLVRYDTTRDADGSIGYSLGCGGAIDVLIEPLNTPEGKQLMQKLHDSRSHPLTIATVLSRHHESMPLGHHLYFDTAVALATDAELFLETLHPPLQLIIFGSGTDVLPLTQFARNLGWNVTVADLGSGLHIGQPWPADNILRCHINQIAQYIALTENTAAVVMTHNFNHDRQLIRWLSAEPIKYLGLLGPRHRTQQLLADIDPPALHSPIGLDLGAENPQEVALAIVAEITAVLHGRRGGLLRDITGPIHPDSPAASRSKVTVGELSEHFTCAVAAS